MQNSIPKFRQSSIISEKPGYFVNYSHKNRKKRHLCLKSTLPFRKRLFYLLQWKLFKTDKNCFSLHLTSPFCSQCIFQFLSLRFGQVEKTAWLEDKVSFKIYHISTRLTNHCNIQIAQYLKKWSQPDNEIWSVNRIWQKYFSSKITQRMRQGN